ncbi:MAG: PQQ-dependent sugar dehydrogenase [Opitutaceae bacterium]|nr:PQQ-dependent sugar dehydrogenase [Opitutaceae bacterium]
MHFKRFVLLFSVLLLVARGEDREGWTDSRIQGSPEVPSPYVAESVWPHITFNQPLDITLLESEGALFVTERFGKIWQLPGDMDDRPEAARLIVDMQSHISNLNRLLGLAFHPEFERNRKFYLYYALNTRSPGFGLALSEFEMDSSWTVLPGSGRTLLDFPAAGHSGGDVQFGPDGMLYVPIGDLTPPSPPDPNLSGQDLSQIASKILRIDVDGRDPELPYRIPKDNPFLGVEGARPEIWAYGFRNPWKISFHPRTGDLWVGDVGWELWEMVYRVEKGGNYGWSVMEGPMPTNAYQKIGPNPIVPPTTAYDHSQGASITGGYFVTSDRLPGLQDSYVYGDYVTGKVWSLNWDGETVTSNREIADTRQAIVTFGQDAAGDILFLELAPNVSLQRFVANSDRGRSDSFPKRLSETGIFSDVSNQSPSRGVYGFEINTPMWQDGNESDYWVAMPGKSGLSTNVEDRRGSPHMNYVKPKDMVLAKTIQKDGYRIETQVLHFDGYWKGYSYQWDENQIDARLVGKEGLDTEVLGEPYRFSSRDECIRCHGSNFNRPLAFFPGQMNREGQLQRFKNLGIVDEVFVEMAKAQPLVDPSNASESIELRARSWLHSNCAHCHKVSGGSGLTAQMNAAVPTDKLELVGFPPNRGYFGLEGASQIDPGNPYRSILYYRVATKGAGHMPMIGAKTLDQEGVQLVHDWIRSLNPESQIPESTLAPQSVEEALALYHEIQSGALSPEDQKRAIAACLSHSDPFVVNLFSAFSKE